MNIQEAYYESKFETLFLKVKGNSFQELFEKLMGLAYKADFMPCRPWGKRGDKKNDGFLKSERCLFQVYAPNEMQESQAIKKISEDFEGAKQHWNTLFDKWVFVHNAYDGLPPHVQTVLLEFEKNNPGIEIEHWSINELKDVFRKINEDDLVGWIGFAPKAETRTKLGFSDLQVVIENIDIQADPLTSQVKEVPSKKIEANALSDCVAELLKHGMGKAHLVEDFFSKWHDETLGEKVAEAFKAKYIELRRDLTPNQIFSELQSWAGGSNRGTPEHELAVLTVISYYFERCDIFEEPKGVNS